MQAVVQQRIVNVNDSSIVLTFANLSTFPSRRYSTLRHHITLTGS